MFSTIVALYFRVGAHFGKEMTLNPLPSGIRDSHRRGAVGDFLKEKIKNGSALSIVTAYFTIYAQEVLLYKTGHQA